MILQLKRFFNRMRTALLFDVLYPWVEYGDNVHVQWSVKIFSPNRLIRIGNHVGIGARAVINTDVIIGNHVMIAAHAGLVARDAHSHKLVGTTMFESPRGDQFRIVIEDDVWIGFGAIVLSGVRIGRGSIVGAGAIVVRDVPPYSIVGMRPADVISQRFGESEVAAHEQALRDRGVLRYDSREFDES